MLNRSGLYKTNSVTVFKRKGQSSTISNVYLDKPKKKIYDNQYL
jgi:hypothetical protein